MQNELASPLVEMKNISKRFGHVKALDTVDMVVHRQEIVGLVGDNGAGKSSLIKILVGVYQPDEGELYFDGRKVRWRSPREARENRIETVHQNLGLLDLMSISRNFFLGKEPLKGPFLDKEKMDQDSIKALKSFGIKLDNPNETVVNLSGGERQAIAIAKAKYFGAKLLVLDEPTAALSIQETRKVLDVILDAKQKGAGIIFITHNIRHVYSVGDRFVILSHGKKIFDVKKEQVSIDDIENSIVTGMM